MQKVSEGHQKTVHMDSSYLGFMEKWDQVTFAEWHVVLHFSGEKRHACRFFLQIVILLYDQELCSPEQWATYIPEYIGPQTTKKVGP